MITSLYIQNFKIFDDFSISIGSEMNIIVGNNEAGKSTLLEAIGMALTKRINGRAIESELTSYLFNKDAVATYVAAVQGGKRPVPPKIVVEIFLSDEPSVAALRGTHNHAKENAPGVRLEIAFNEEYQAEYEALLKNPADVLTLPTEYYSVQWASFAGSGIGPRGMPVGLSYIDATSIRLQSGTDFYLQGIINNGLLPNERAALAVAYRSLKEKFADEPAIQGINAKLTQTKGAITDKDLAITIDVSQRTNWETNLVPHLDDLPFHLVGKGEQSALKIMLALERQANDANVILIEEPENHLSFSSLQKLINKIKEKCAGKQIILTTHSAYVLNKLGLDKTILLNGPKTASLTDLPHETQRYFRKLSGYDTLRIILAERSILVEGPSDELILQKAYFAKHGRPAMADGVDILNVRGLSFARFLDIARPLGKQVAVVTDNDGNYAQNVEARYKDYMDVETISICADPDDSAQTLEPQFLKFNDLATMNRVLGTRYTTPEQLLSYMSNNKTEWALRVFDTKVELKFPDYILRAI